jgi:hypothetical protein
MTDTADLSQRDIKTLFDAMGEELAAYGPQFVFIQLRVSAEHFVVPLCGLSVESVVRLLQPDQYHVYFEKKLPRFKQGPIDLLLVPIAKDGTEDWNSPYCFEFKMVWLKGIKDNVSGIKKDIDKLGGYERGFAVAVLFSFDGGPYWAPYAHKGDMERLVKEVVSEIDTPVYEGQEYRIASREVEAKSKLVAWAANR